MENILVIQTAFTGDVVLSTALLEKLHTFFPKAAIDILVRNGNEGLLLGHPFVHETLIWNKKANKNKNLFSLLLRIRKNRYDIVVNLQRFASTGLLTAFSRAKEKIGFDKNPFSFLFTKKIKHLLSDGLHEVERNNKLVEHLTDNTFSKPRLYPTETNFDDIKKYMSVKYICMTPASVWFTKQYPEEKWVELIDRFPNEYNIFLLGGKDDAVLCEKIKEKTIKTNVVVLAGKLSFLSSAALMTNAHMNYTNDSAPLHFASAVDAPVTAIFCSTIPGFGFYPLSTKSIIAETKEVLSCRPCSIHGLKACPLGHFKCAYTIEIEQLLQAMRQ